MADDPKPPYVKFELRAVEDREATIEAGHYVGKDVVFAIVVPAGTRDKIEREATDWLLNIEEGVKQERIPAFWYDTYKRALDDFKANRETPEEGTAILDWPTASPSVAKMLIDINVRTVEQLADANEETVQRIGMGGRALKEKAQIWLDSSKDKGKLTEEVSQLRVQNEELLARDKEREAQFKSMQTQLDALTKGAKEKEKA